MFTGIVEEVGTILQTASDSLKIKAGQVLEGTKVGDSIAVSGVCLTVTTLGKDFFTADVMPETFRCTALGRLKTGSFVNLERALTLNARLGGHIVSGHVDSIGTIDSFRPEGNAVILTVKTEPKVLKYIVAKGSVALDGISLTVVDVKSDSFSVSLIPHTREVTALKSRQPGDLINIETDIIGHYVEKMLADKTEETNRTSHITRDFLARNGF